jgi:transposase
LAAHKKNARRLNATIVLYDESGFMLRPLVRKTWALRGQTPIIKCWDRRDRLSVIGGIIVPSSALRTRDRAAQRHQLSAVFRIHANNIQTPQATEFLRVLERHVQGPLIVVQDKLNVHRAAVKRWLAERAKSATRSGCAPPRVMVEWLPSYAPELNPAEQLWNNSKRVDLANVAPADRHDLRTKVRRSLIRQRTRPNHLASAFDHAGLSL